MSRRTLKAASAIREVVSMTILTQLRDPRVQDVTVTLVEVAPDMRMAKVHVSIMGDEKKQRLALRGLQNSAGFLQEMIQRRIDTRYTPRLHFVLDQGVKNSLQVTKILDELRAKGELPPLHEDPLAEIDSAENDLTENDLTENDLTENDLTENDLTENDLTEGELAEIDSAENDSAEELLDDETSAELEDAPLNPQSPLES